MSQLYSPSLKKGSVAVTVQSPASLLMSTAVLSSEEQGRQGNTTVQLPRTFHYLACVKVFTNFKITFHFRTKFQSITLSRSGDKHTNSIPWNRNRAQLPSVWCFRMSHQSSRYWSNQLERPPFPLVAFHLPEPSVGGRPAPGLTLWTANTTCRRVSKSQTPQLLVGHFTAEQQ